MTKSPTSEAEYDRWQPIAIEVADECDGDPDMVRLTLKNRGCPGIVMRSLMNHLRGRGLLPLLQRELTEDIRHHANMDACQAHLEDLRNAGHTPLLTELRIKGGRGVITARRQAIGLEPGRSYCGSAAAMCSDAAG